MDTQRTDILRGAFGMTSTSTSATAAASAEVNSAKSAKSSQDLYNKQYKKFIAKGMSPKQAAAFADQFVKRAKGL